MTVPNSSHGKRGTCPACQKKLIVPRPAGEPPSTVPAGAQTLPEATPSVAPAIPAAAAPISENLFSDPIPSAADPAMTDGGSAPAIPPGGTPRPLVPEAPNSVASTIQRRRKKRSSSAVLTIGIPVVCFAAFIGVMAFIFSNTQPELKGTINGASLPNFNLAASRLSIANLPLEDVDSSAVSAEFEAEPERFISEMMKCTVGADGRQLTIDVEPGDGYQWFTVNPTSDANLLDWVKKNAEIWNQKRRVRMQEVAASLCRDKLRRASGERVVIDAAKYRDGFALATQVRGFGYLVEAIAETKRAVCAHEDANGTLYFCLPEDTTSFVLQGRSLGEQTPAFPGRYTVTISSVSDEDKLDESTQPPAAEQEQAPENPEPMEDSDGMTDDGKSQNDMAPQSMNMQEN